MITYFVMHGPTYHSSGNCLNPFDSHNGCLQSPERWDEFCLILLGSGFNQTIAPSTTMADHGTSPSEAQCDAKCSCNALESAPRKKMHIP